MTTDRHDRMGPRPLALHLLNQAWTLLSWRAGLPLSSNGSPNWSAPLAPQAAALARDLANVAPEAFAAAVEAESHARLAGFLDGVEAYRRHPWRRRLSEPPTIWRQGTTRLLDYGAAAMPDAPTVLMVPSLVNRGIILDLTERRSLARWLAARGLRPLLVDWDAPGPQERHFTLTDYVRRLDAMLELAAASGKAVVLGYCMGGLLALALAARRPDQVAGLALLATPWDFHAPSPRQAEMLGRLRPLLESLITTVGVLPVDVLQALFAALDPTNAGRKFTAFAALKPNSAKARAFVILEDWLNDGVPLAAAVARECLDGWYGRNTPARSAWIVDGQPVRTSAINVPCMVVIPGRDRIVPPESAIALARDLPNVHCRVVAAGHIGMLTGRDAPTKVYRPLARWIGNVATHKQTCPSVTLKIKTTA